MRCALVICIGILLLAACGGDDSTNATNDPPVITTITATPDAVPNNRTAALIVTASDADAGDVLTYVWTAAAGSFAAGNTTAQVTWVPPTTQTGYTISVTVSDGTASVDTSITINVIRPVFNLSGHIYNQDGEAADSVTMDITDVEDAVRSVISSGTGSYSLPDLPGGPVQIAMSSPEIVVHDLPRYLDKDTSINLTQDNAVDMQIREFHNLFYDDGNDTSQWVFGGDVQNDGTKYIIGHSSGDDNMTMRENFHFPANAAVEHTGILIQAQTSPSGSSVLTRIIYAGNNSWSRNLSIGGSQAWYQVSLSDIPDLAGLIGKVRFRYDDPNKYMFIWKVWIFCY